MVEVKARLSAASHSCVLRPTFKHELSHRPSDKYGRMFPGLRKPEASVVELIALGRSGAVMVDTAVGVRVADLLRCARMTGAGE